jgi:hypothetical protein
VPAAVGNVIEFNRWVDEDCPARRAKPSANYPPDFLLPICFLMALYVGMYDLNIGNY